MVTVTTKKFRPPEMHRTTIEMTDSEAGALHVVLIEASRGAGSSNPQKRAVAVSLRDALANRNGS